MLRSRGQNFLYVGLLRVCGADRILSFGKCDGAISSQIDDGLCLTVKTVNVTRRMVVGIDDKQDTVEPE